MASTTHKMTYSVGDVIFWGKPTTAGEWTFIGHPVHGRSIGGLVDLPAAREAAKPVMAQSTRVQY